MATDPTTLINLLTNQVPSLDVYDEGSDRFNDFRSYYNLALTDKPLAIARPKSEHEVSKTVAFCSNNNIPLAVRSGGHDFFGRSLIKDGLVLDLRELDTINIAADKKTVHVGGGVIAGSLQQALEARGLFTPTGQAKTVGYVSWACGGGYGFYVGTYGFGVDQVVGARVAIADGSIIDTDDDKELLWALRGAGAGTFGIIVELRVKVYPTPKIYAGFLGFPLTEAGAVFSKFQALVSDKFPDEFSGDAIVARPQMLQLPHSEPCFIFYWCWTAVCGGITPGKTFLQKMRGLGTVLVDSVDETTPAAFGGGDLSSATFFRSCNVANLEPELGAILARHQPTQPLAAVVVHNNHGKGVKDSIADGIGSIFSNRRDHIILGLHGGTSLGGGFDSDAFEESKRWVLGLEKDVLGSRMSLSRSFASFSPPEDADPVMLFGVTAARRLSVLKARLDAGGMFNKSFPCVR